MATYIIVAILAYLLGSINFSVLISQKMAGFDVREKGSGNAGSTNVLRAVGVKAAVITLICDILKGVVAVLIGVIAGNIVKDLDRAVGLEKVLYQCPRCLTEYEMQSDGITLKCNHCGKTWEVNEHLELVAKEGKTEFPHIPDWYEWERDNVRKEIEAGKYRFETPVRIDALPNAKKFIDLGMGTLIHDMNGFRLSGVADNEEFTMDWPAKDNYSVHIEYEYLFKHGDCVDLNTLTDTFYVYPKCDKFSVTKMSLACEELYKFYNKK